jgi:hypothetical protein
MEFIEYGAEYLSVRARAVRANRTGYKLKALFEYSGIYYPLLVHGLVPVVRSMKSGSVSGICCTYCKAPPL